MNLETRAKNLHASIDAILDSPHALEEIPQMWERMEIKYVEEFKAVEKETIRTLIVVLKERVARAIDRIHAEITE